MTRSMQPAVFSSSQSHGVLNNAPDLNPDEWVWNNVKNDRVGRKVIMGKDDLKAKAIGALRRLQKLPDVVRGFFRDPHLSYILD